MYFAEGKYVWVCWGDARRKLLSLIEEDIRSSIFGFLASWNGVLLYILRSQVEKEAYGILG